MKKLTALILALILTLALAGCDVDLPDQDKLQGDESYRNAAKTMEKLESVAFDAELNLTVQSGDFSLPLSMQANGESTENPRMVHSHLRAGLDIAALTMEIYTQESEDELFTYTGLNLLGETTWTCTAEPRGETLPVHAPQVLNLLAEMKPAGEGITRDGRHGTCYEGVITPDNVRRLIHALQVMDTTGQTDDAVEELEEMLDELDPDTGVPVSTVLDTAMGWLLELNVDMTATVRDLIRQEEELQDVDIPELSFRVTFRDHNRVEPITIPEEALLSRGLG